MKSSINKIRASLVHFLTGSGIIFSFLALVSVIEGYKLQTFMFLGVALIIDIIDLDFTPSKNNSFIIGNSTTLILNVSFSKTISTSLKKFVS